MVLVRGNVDYIKGHLRYGHFELDLDDEDLEEFEKLTTSEKIERLETDGNIDY